MESNKSNKFKYIAMQTGIKRDVFTDMQIKKHTRKMVEIVEKGISF